MSTSKSESMLTGATRAYLVKRNGQNFSIHIHLYQGLIFMTTSQPTPFLSEIIEGARIPEEKLAYFRSRLKNRLHAMVLFQFVSLERDRNFTKAELARRLGKKPEQITRWLGAPGNWTIDTISDLLLGMGHEPRLVASSLADGAILPANEDWRIGESGAAPPVPEEPAPLANKPDVIDTNNVISLASRKVQTDRETPPRLVNLSESNEEPPRVVAAFS